MVAEQGNKERNLESVKVDEKFEHIFVKAQEYVGKYFRNRLEDPGKGVLEISGERYILIRAAAMSVELFELITTLYRDRGDKGAKDKANDFLFDISHALGKAESLAADDCNVNPRWRLPLDLCFALLSVVEENADLQILVVSKHVLVGEDVRCLVRHSQDDAGPDGEGAEET